MPPDKAIEILKWCIKKGLETSELIELLAILDKKVELPPPKKKGKKSKGTNALISSKQVEHNYKVLRESTEKSLMLVAGELKISPMTLRKLESGDGTFNPLTISKVNSYYGVE